MESESRTIFLELPVIKQFAFSVSQQFLCNLGDLNFRFFTVWVDENYGLQKEIWRFDVIAYREFGRSVYVDFWWTEMGGNRMLRIVNVENGSPSF